MIKILAAIAVFVPTLTLAQEQTPDTPIQSPIFFINREVPCAPDSVVANIHAELGLVDIAVAENVNRQDELATVVILHNAETGKIAVELRSEAYGVTCNLISADNFTLIN
jgi:hypothetical protein